MQSACGARKPDFFAIWAALHDFRRICRVSRETEDRGMMAVTSPLPGRVRMDGCSAIQLVHQNLD